MVLLGRWRHGCRVEAFALHIRWCSKCSIRSRTNSYNPYQTIPNLKTGPLATHKLNDKCLDLRRTGCPARLSHLHGPYPASIKLTRLHHGLPHGNHLTLQKSYFTQVIRELTSRMAATIFCSSILQPRSCRSLPACASPLHDATIPYPLPQQLDLPINIRMERSALPHRRSRSRILQHTTETHFITTHIPHPSRIQSWDDP